MIIIKDKELTHRYLSDGSNLKNISSQIQIIIPETESELIEYIKYHQNPITISGAGTGNVGARLCPIGDLISMEKLNSIGEIENVGGNYYIEVGSGVVLRDLQKHIQDRGYFLPTNPTENSSFIGGNIATNASGSRSFLFGSIRNFVEKLYLLFPNGETKEISRGDFTLQTGENQLAEFKFHLPFIKRFQIPFFKNSTGYFNQSPMDAVDLFVGGEGTLAINYKSRLKIIPEPQEIISGIFFFSQFDHLFSVVKIFRQMRSHQHSSTPMSVEYYDHNCIQLLNSQIKMSTHASHALYLEGAVFNCVQNNMLENWLEILESNKCLLEESFISQNVQQNENLRKFRHFIPLQILEKLEKYQQRKYATDCGIPIENFQHHLEQTVQMALEKNIEHYVFGHIGDCHLHINLIPKNDLEKQTCLEIFEKSTLLAIKMGGTISSEHGIGRIKKKFLTHQFNPQEIQEFINLKKSFDPNFRLNHGILFL